MNKALYSVIKVDVGSKYLTIKKIPQVFCKLFLTVWQCDILQQDVHPKELLEI